MAEVLIRFAKEEDVAEVDKLLFQVHKIHSDARPDLFIPGAKKYTDEELKSIFNDPHAPVFIAETDGKIVGYAFCILQLTEEHHGRRAVKTLYIDDLCVDKNARGCHVGTTLYRRVLCYAKEQGCYNVTLNVWSCNPSALRFYEKIGLVPQKIGMETIL